MEMVSVGDQEAGTHGTGRRPSGDTFSVTILIKRLELTGGDGGECEDAERLKLLLSCGQNSVAATGTLDSLNKQKLGNVIGLQTNLDQFVRFLNESSIDVTLKRDETILAQGALRLQDTGVIGFDPQHDGGQPVVEKFPLLGNGTEKPIALVTMVLNAERNTAPPFESLGDGQLDPDDIIYVVNEDRRRASEQQQQDEFQRQLLVCDRCNVLRSPEEFSCEYELVDGILHSKTVTSTEREIDRIKQKLRDVALDETIGQRGSLSSNGGDGGDAAAGKICGLCRGLTITGVTCAPDGSGSSSRKVSIGRESLGGRQEPPAHQAKEPSQNHKAATTKFSINRCCERCKTCLNWLPDVCRCPKCGHKTREPKPGDHATKRTHLFPSLPASDLGVGSGESSSPKRSDSQTMLASSESCPICHIRQCRCVDCARRMHTSEPASSCTVDTSEVLHPGYGGKPRPITRRSTNGGRRLPRPREADSSNGNVRPTARRCEQMRQTYTAKVNPKADPQAHAAATRRLSGAQIRRNYNAFIRKVKLQNRNLYSYRFGRRHPGMVVGHKACMAQEQPVPAHMGWRWNVCTEGIGKRRPGWRPGAIRKPIVQLMQHFLKCYPTDNLPVGGGKRTVSFPQAAADERHAGQKSTLHVTRHHGEYSVTLNPLKDSEALKNATDPYLPCKPIKFLLTKDPRLTKLYLLRDELKAKGLSLCACRELQSCPHRSEREKRLLALELQRAAKRVGLPLDTTIADLPSRCESELNFEFTPPSAIIRPDARRPDVVLAETQYCEEDFQIKKPPAAATESKRPEGRKQNGGRGKPSAPKPAAAKRPPTVVVSSGQGKGDGVGKPGAPKKAGTLAEGKGAGVRISVAKAKGAVKK